MANILSALAVVLLAAVLFFVSSAVNDLHGDYALLSGTELTAEERSFIGYDDKLLTQLIFASNDDFITMDEFLNKCLREIDTRIITIGIVYTAAISAMFIFSIGRSKRKIIPAAAVTVIPVFILYIAAAFGIMIFHKMPVFIPSGKMLITIAAGLYPYLPETVPLPCL